MFIYLQLIYRKFLGQNLSEKRKAHDKKDRLYYKKDFSECFPGSVTVKTEPEGDASVTEMVP